MYILKHEPKYIIKYNTIRVIYVQIKALKGHTEKFNYALKKAPINSHIYITGKIVVSSQSASPLHSVVYTISEKIHQIHLICWYTQYRTPQLKDFILTCFLYPPLEKHKPIYIKRRALTKAARKAADSSTFLHSDSFEFNTDKSQGNSSFLVFQLQINFFLLTDIKEVFM